MKLALETVAKMPGLTAGLIAGVVNVTEATGWLKSVIPLTEAH